LIPSNIVAKLRAEKELSPLHAFLIDVISSTSVSIDHADMDWLREHKLSSTFIRQWIVGRTKQNEDKAKTEFEKQKKDGDEEFERN